ncbi:MAG: co-chaperone GroES [Candidatus Shikimatogenerans sp. Ttur]|uniref:10 kDa chaperonin n=1 Tax=Candidatus Shikimatogenerans sp. Ttur TaxID=3158569 RepID=A0AAU7ZXG1_9FLAO
MSTLNIKPLHDRVLIKPIEKKNKRKIILNNIKQKLFRGKIIAIGSGKYNFKMTVKIGDIVLYNKYSGVKIKFNNNKYLIMHESDILAII